jgi:hypothetical protein
MAFELRKTIQKAIFERVVNKNGTTIMKAQPQFKGDNAVRFSIYSQDVGAHELLITTLGQKEWNMASSFLIFKTISDWFDHNLVIFYPTTKIYPFDFIDLEESDDKEFYRKVLHMLRTGINEIEFRSENADEIMNKISEDQKK